MTTNPTGASRTPHPSPAAYPLIAAHRGASADFVENTVDAFRGAVAQGADWVELDVRSTADGVLVVHHDPLLADGTAIAAVRRSDLPSHVPTLADAFGAASPLGVNVEIKNSEGEPGYDPSGALAVAVVEEIARSAGTREVLVSSFDLATIDRVLQEDPAMPTGYLVFGPDDPHDTAAEAVEHGHGALHPWDHLVTESSVRRCRDLGLALNVWTVDDPGRIAMLADWGVDMVITNRPAMARAAVHDAARGD
ncbi:MAG: glycerophosphodiester phosphodiesterase [Microthrixaceae bacterium]